MWLIDFTKSKDFFNKVFNNNYTTSLSLVLLVVILVTLVSVQEREMKQELKVIQLKDYQPSNYLVENLNLKIDIYADRTLVTADMLMYRNPKLVATDGVFDKLELDGRQLKLLKLTIDGEQPALDTYQATPDKLTILNPKEKFVLHTEVEIYPEQNTLLSGLYATKGSLMTQCEAEGFRAITYYLDRPDVMTDFSVTLSADKATYPVLLSNGNLVDKGDLEENRHYTKWVDPFKKPAYLFAMVAGDLEHITGEFITKSGRKVALKVYAAAKDITKCDYALASLKQAMLWDEKTYNLEYDLDTYMIVVAEDFTAGAMENKGLNIFNNKYVLASPEIATDENYKGIERVIGHEYFHNWTGNRITLRDWFQLSLKEGLTVFRENQFAEDMNSKTVNRIKDVQMLRNAQFPEDSGPMAHPVRPAEYASIDNFYTATVYEKGAEVIGMLRTVLGEEGYKKGFALYVERHDGTAATTDDFRRAMSDANGVDLSQFETWYSQAGTPTVTVTEEYNEDKQEYKLIFTQSCRATKETKNKKDFIIPIATSLLVDGQELELGEIKSFVDYVADEVISTNTIPKEQALRSVNDKVKILVMTAKEQKFLFKRVPKKPIPVMLQGFSAPIKLSFPYTVEDLATIVNAQVDGFSRYEAMQLLLLSEIKAFVKFYKDNNGQSLEGYGQHVLPVFKQLLQSNEEDRALLAELISLPSYKYLSEQFSKINVDALVAAKHNLLQLIAKELSEELFQLYRAVKQEGPYVLTQEAIASRSLQNTLLDYLAYSESVSQELVANQYDTADNMTNSLAALSAAVKAGLSSKDRLLQDFYNKWQHDSLVVNKWLTIQSSLAPDNLLLVTKLADSNVFDLKNPNNVYALLLGFTSNFASFHRIDGKGYAFVADYVIKLDKINGKVAARLAKTLTGWRKLDAARAELMRSNLERIGNEETLSKDVREVVQLGLNN